MSSVELTFLGIILVLRLLTFFINGWNYFVFRFTNSANANAFIRRKFPYIFKQINDNLCFGFLPGYINRLAVFRTLENTFLKFSTRYFNLALPRSSNNIQTDRHACRHKHMQACIQTHTDRRFCLLLFLHQLVYTYKVLIVVELFPHVYLCMVHSGVPYAYVFWGFLNGMYTPKKWAKKDISKFSTCVIYLKTI